MTIDNFIERKLDLIHLPAYALFLKNHRLEELVKEQLRIARAIKVPMLKYFEGVPESELLRISMASTAVFLDFLVQNKVEEQIAATTKQWVENQLPQINRHQVVAEDITLVSYMRKEAMMKFLPQFAADVNQVLEIIREIDQYIVKSVTTSTNTYINLLKDGLAEETHFNNSIADTAPGIIFIYDLENARHIYINEKVEQLYGYSPAELKEPGYKVYTQLIHPEDQQAFDNRYENLLPLKDGQVTSLEYRFKLKNGDYRWLRNYESVFKRNEEGKPIHMIGFAINIDIEKQTAQQLLDSREALLEAQDVAEMGSFIWDLVSDRSESSPQTKKILQLSDNWSMQDFIGKVHPADRQRLQHCLDQALQGNGDYDCEYRYFIGEKKKVLWSRGVVIFENGRPVTMKGTVMDVTERHHMVEKLQRSEELYKQAQALSHMGNWTWDIRTNEISWTDELYRIFGLTPQSEPVDLVKFFSFVHAEDREKRMTELELALQSHQPHEYDFRIVLRDGSIKMLHGQAEVLLDIHGKPFRMFGACQDVTQQKLVEKELRENQNFIRKIADAAPSIISAYNVHTGKYLFINQAFEKLLGYRKEEVMALGVAFFINIVHPDDLQMLTERNQQAIAIANAPGYSPTHEVIMEFTYRIKHKNGNYRWLQTYGTIFDRNPNNEIEHLLNISADITDIVETQQKMKEQEHFIQQVADASPTVLYLFDVKTASIIYINKEIENVLGFQPADVIAMGSNVIPQIFHPDDAAQMHMRLKEYNLQDNPKTLFQFECRLKNAKDEWCWCLVREVVFRRNANGKVSEVLGAALDISLRKNMEDTLHHQTIALQQSNTSLEEFAYVASHDLKEPLRKISTYSDRLLTSFNDFLPAEANNYLDRIIDSSRRMQQLIDDLLSISMISGEKNFTRYSLKALAEEALQTLEHKIEEKKAIVNLDHLPEATVIPSQFRQLFQNLFSNSLKFYNKDASPKISVSYSILRYAEVSQMHLNKSSRYLQIKIDDNGIGFEEHFADKIFTIFQRLHNRTQYEGTGIGLAICKRIVENHGGVIFAAGEPNKGATFTIIIPHTA